MTREKCQNSAEKTKIKRKTAQEIAPGFIIQIANIAPAYYTHNKDRL